MYDLTDEEGNPITPRQAVLRLVGGAVLTVLTLVALYWATVFAFCC